MKSAPSASSVFLVAIQVEALDRHRLLSDITRALADEKVNILSASVTTSNDRVAISRFTFEMGDPKHLGHLLNAVRNVEGVYDVYRGGPAPSIVDAVQIPVNDPMMVVPVMAAVTEHIGFGVTANLTYEPPYLFARRMSTLDHLTRGRVGWNIVTGYLDSAARGMGLSAQPDHDGRYGAADEYMSVVYQLWEASWEEGAVRRDKSNRIFRRSGEDPSRTA